MTLGVFFVDCNFTTVIEFTSLGLYGDYRPTLDCGRAIKEVHSNAIY